MFAVEYIELTNFRSYIGDHVFRLPEDSGLYKLTGRNLSNPALGSNGAGKSTILDALFWCLYGRTTRGLKATDIVSWGQKGCSVAVALTVAHKRAVVRRSQSPNSLTLTDDGGTSGQISQEALEKYLRLTPEALLHSVILPQFGEAFFDLTPAAKLGLFSAIMELDYWLERSQAAQDRKNILANDRSLLGVSLSNTEGKCETINGDIETLKGREAGFSKAQREHIKGLEADLAEAVKGVTDDSAEVNYCKNVLTDLEKKIAALSVKKLCVTCKQPLPNDDLNTVRKNKTDFERRLWQVQSQKQNALKLRAELSAAISKEEKKPNPYAEMINEKRGSLIDLRAKIDELKAAIDKTEQELAAVSFWVGGFKRVRLFIVEEALRQLEIEVNNNLTNLGLTDWYIAFDVERENKTGGITKGFVVMIHPPGSSEPIRYEAYSGGETQRLRLAGDLGLANLIMERAGLSNTIEFYDEPSCHLSQEGLTDLAETLAQRAADQEKIILLVDHNVVDFDGFAGTFTVVKDAEGSRLA